MERNQAKLSHHHHLPKPHHFLSFQRIKISPRHQPIQRQHRLPLKNGHPYRPSLFIVEPEFQPANEVRFHAQCPARRDRVGRDAHLRLRLALLIRRRRHWAGDDELRRLFHAVAGGEKSRAIAAGGDGLGGRKRLPSVAVGTGRAGVQLVLRRSAARRHAADFGELDAAEFIEEGLSPCMALFGTLATWISAVGEKSISFAHIKLRHANFHRTIAR